MKERPILFSGPMVRAILAGIKTQTRRLVKVRSGHYRGLPTHAYRDGDAWWTEPGGVTRCPYGEPGDRLWVREKWQAIHGGDIDPKTGYYGDDVHAALDIPLSSVDGYWRVAYASTVPRADEHQDDRCFAWRPSIHMPRWASRILLDVVSVRVERLNDISLDDCEAEGIGIFRAGDGWYDIPGSGRVNDGPVEVYSYLWEYIHGVGSWDQNPLVWVVEFGRPR